ncbi:MAG: glycosyltransferase family 10 [Pseudomonadota bacterium]
MMLVRIAKDWSSPDLMRQTPGQGGIWDGIKFTTEPVQQCDLLLVLNNRLKAKVQVECRKENVWALMQEPYVRGFNDWMAEGHDSLFRVFTHHSPVPGGKYVTSHPAIPWHVNRSYDQLVFCNVPPKTRMISWIVGNASDLAGHRKRLSFLRFIQHNFSGIDLLGRAVKYVDDKWDGLASYRYSLAVENSSSPDYWTEKVADCFLTWTVPFYYGCTNLEQYFPQDSFIRIDIDRPETSLALIKSMALTEDWERRLPALDEARRLVLNKYQMFPHIAGLIKSYWMEGTGRSLITVPAYKKSKKTLLYRAAYKLNRRVKGLFCPYLR